MFGFVEGVSYRRRRNLLEMGQGQRTGVPAMRNTALTRPDRQFDGRRQGTIRLEVRATNHDIKSAATPSGGRRLIDFRSAQHNSRWSRRTFRFVDGGRRSRRRRGRNSSFGHWSILHDKSAAENWKKIVSIGAAKNPCPGRRRRGMLRQMSLEIPR